MAGSSNTKRKQKGKTRLLSNSRPSYPLRSTGATLSSKATRSLIRSHHNLNKRLAQAEVSGDDALATKLRVEIEAQGGLAKYQEASIRGQAADRGGDSSKVLIEWLRELEPSISQHKSDKLRLLEVGALKVDNACSRCGWFDVERVDLNSQHDQILQQDFMERPLPINDDERQKDGFDVISLSLVVNYVPEPVGRGEMLKRVASFLRQPKNSNSLLFPGLFLVLPSSCVTNSRYLDERRVKDMLASLGYVLLRKKISSKLVYYYLKHRTDAVNQSARFAKQEIHAGGKRNNFAIILK